MKHTRCIAMLLALGGAISAQAVDTFFYATNTKSELYIVNGDTGAKTLIGNHGIFLESLATVKGALYGADASGNLYQLSTVNAAPTFIGNTGLGNIEGLDFNGRDLVAVDFGTTPSFYSLNTGDASATLLSVGDQSIGSARSLAFTSDPTLAYMPMDQPVYQTLANVNPYTGDITQYGDISSFGFTAAIGFNAADTVLYAFGATGTISRIDSSLNLLGTSSTGDDFWLGLADAEPVPEPATMAVLGLGVAAMLRRRKK